MLCAYCLIRIQTRTREKPGVFLTFSRTLTSKMPLIACRDPSVFDSPWDPDESITIILRYDEKRMDICVGLYDVCSEEETVKTNQLEVVDKELTLAAGTQIRMPSEANDSLNTIYIPQTSGKHHVWWEVIKLDFLCKYPHHGDRSLCHDVFLVEKVKELDLFTFPERDGSVADVRSKGPEEECASSECGGAEERGTASGSDGSEEECACSECGGSGEEGTSPESDGSEEEKSDGSPQEETR